jgi:hypothetical protein
MAFAAWVALPLGAGAQGKLDAVPKLALATHPRQHLPPQLILRSSFYLDLELEESAPSTAPETEAAAEVPDIDILSQRAIEHYEIQSAERQTPRYPASGRPGRSGERSRGAKAGIAVRVIVGVGLVVFGIAAAVAVSNSFDDF